MKNDIVIVAELDWEGLHNQSHVIALGFANRGHRVFYINRTLQRWPTGEHLLRRLNPNKNRGYVNTYPHPPKNLYPITLWVGPPVQWLRIINSFIIKNTIKKYRIKNPILITYIPTFTTIDIIKILKPKLIAYICYHNFDADDDVLPDLLLAEKELIRTSDVLFADSIYLQNRIKKMAGNKEVFRSIPGVYYGLFRQAFRGDESKYCKTLYYFGGIGPHLDLSLYTALASRVRVIFVGVVNPVIRRKIPTNIEIQPPVANSELPTILKEADIIGLFYKDSPYIRGVLPAKFFECLATGKPLLVSGLKETTILYSDVIYDVQGSLQNAIEIIQRLPQTETAERLLRRDVIAKDADWANRFHTVATLIENAYNQKYKNEYK